MKPTLRDIADATGVSIATVSKVLNGKPIRVSDEKRNEILTVAEGMNYRANPAARALVTNRSGLIGLIVPDIENPYFSRLAKHLEKHCLHQGSVLLILNSNEQADGDLRLLDVLSSRRVDAIFYCPSFEAFNDHRVKEKLTKLFIPLIQVDRAFESLPYSKVTFDNEQGAYRATDYLLSKGHEKIGLIAPPLIQEHPTDRLQGYLRALKEKGCAPEDSWIFYGDYGYNSGYQGGLALIETEVTAVFSCNDRMTLGFLKALREKGKSVPKDLSLISNDNLTEDFTFGIAITTVIQDASLLADACFHAYRTLTEKGEITETLLQPTFVERNSVDELPKS